MSKRDIERKQLEEQKATAYAFQEFIRTFQDNAAPVNKTFVKSGVINAKPGQESDFDRGVLYNPQPIIKPTSSTIKNAIECARLLKETKLERTKGQSKPKTNLELLKEELKLRHMERDERSKYKDELSNCASGIYECVDPTTTNLFIANISPKTAEQDLLQLFGAYGPLASVKIMWPRGEDKNRNTHCGFVAFMSRKDAERALVDLKDCDDMRIGWGKPVDLPINPIYIPTELMKLSLPPPYSGLPFNAQPLCPNYTYPKTDDEMNELLYNSVVKVTIPLDKKVVMLVHRVIEFVIREGPLFEAMIMNREISNPTFQFLFDNKNPVHVYYRWKMYSILQGEGQKSWSTKEFRMFAGGCVWVPPIIPDYTQGMPQQLLNSSKKNIRKLLSDAQSSRFIGLLQTLTPNRSKISEAMIFCINHTDAAKDVLDIIVESFCNIKTSPVKKIARLYLLSDILYNNNMKKNTINTYTQEVVRHLNNIFTQLYQTHAIMNRTTDKDAFMLRILQVLRSWELWKIFNTEILTQLKSIIAGKILENPTDTLNRSDMSNTSKIIYKPYSIKSNSPIKNTSKPIESESLPGFIPSKWESVDPEQVEAQAMSTKKFYDMQLEMKAQENKKTPERKQAESKKINDRDRDLLRKVEVMVMQYQDELETDKCGHSKQTIEGKLKRYRQNLINKIKMENSTKKKSKSSSSKSSDSSSEDNNSKRDRLRNKKYKKRSSYRRRDRR